MKLNYFEVLSGESVKVPDTDKQGGISQTGGHVRHIKVRELCSSGAGQDRYNLFLNILAMDATDIEERLEKTRALPPRGRRGKLDKKTLGAYDWLVSMPEYLMILTPALDFFVEEKVAWDMQKLAFSLTDGNGVVVGYINRYNYEEYRDVILKFNHVRGLQEDVVPKYEDARAKELWEKAEKLRKAQETKKEPDKNYDLGNIISKLCAAGVGQTFTTIYDLTIYQLYDLFMQVDYLHTMRVCENAYSIHGGEKFQINDWLKRLQNT